MPSLTDNMPCMFQYTDTNVLLRKDITKHINIYYTYQSSMECVHWNCFVFHLHQVFAYTHVHTYEHAVDIFGKNESMIWSLRRCFKQITKEKIPTYGSILSDQFFCYRRKIIQLWCWLSVYHANYHTWDNYSFVIFVIYTS